MMPPPTDPVPLPDILETYTGWFSSDGLHIVIMLEGSTLRLGCLSHIRGDILESWTLCFVPAINIASSTEEETALNRPLQAVAMALPGRYMVSFDIKKGAIHGVSIDTMLYARYKPDTCAIMKVPRELRQMIWRYSLANEAGKVTLEEYGDLRIITNGRTQSQFNRIHEVHPEFATEALHHELYDNTLECTDAARLVELLHSDKGNVKLCLRDVLLSADWGQMPLPPRMPDAHLLKDILRYAKQHKETKFTIRMMMWRLTPINSSQVMLHFLEFGEGIRRAIRGKQSILSIMTIQNQVLFWTKEHDFSGLDADNVKFFPEMDCFCRSLYRAQVAFFLDEVLTDYMAHAPGLHASDVNEAIESVVNDIEEWHKNGI
ncbi:hypothetical protein PtrSN002B_004271 [Pyrenophora tritici-repentis]|nr:hypothetical protein PtrV1_10161 [Pyrenophora tritici-repentis]KAI0583362.1 hypothetical protein Alg130_05701 [Pyrenophora tritici-repentis]KAI0588410.1 hypothetical protein Alg215_00848 [Pyrenophora tritici-repentis]KAI0610349.1 hypothetical protein TUN205_05408 [Pyrenophora tritici-repentis]KAI0622238.1 hypothetical protein TUN199_05775 [Pyrenophora tritici-repentis]